MKVNTAKIIREILNQQEKQSQKEFFSNGLKSLQELKLVQEHEASLLKKLARAKSAKEGLAIVSEMKKVAKSRTVKMEIIPGLTGVLERLQNLESNSDQPSTQSSTGAGNASVIIIGATGAGAAIGTGVGGPGTGTLIGAAVGMLVGGALAVAAIEADGGGGVSGGENGDNDGGDEGGDEGGSDSSGGSDSGGDSGGGGAVG